jgi:hypothetical protein
VWVQQDVSVPPALGNIDLQHILRPRIMNPPHHLIECRGKFCQALLHIGGIEHPLDKAPTGVRLDASNNALVKGLSMAAHISRQEDELEVGEVDED